MLKQVIVVRKDINMRKGKMIAQGAHASLTAAFNAVNNYDTVTFFRDWFKSDQRKIVVGCPTEEILHQLYAEAEARKIPCALIQDHGNTEFHGVPTYTAVAIGPYDGDIIDSITAHWFSLIYHDMFILKIQLPASNLF